MAKALILAIQIEQEKLASKGVARVNELQQQRLDMLAKIHERMMNWSGSTRFEPTSINANFLDLLRAICKYTENREELIKSLDRLLKDAEKTLDLSQSRKEGARGTALPVALVTASLLEVEIEQEKLDTNDKSKIAELQQKRVQALLTVEELGMKLVQQARVELEDVCDSSHELLKATVENTENRDDLIKSLDQLLENVVKMRDIAQQRKEGARGTQLPIAKCEALILAIQIEQEKLAAAK
jgi:RNA binding exosome subunit